MRGLKLNLLLLAVVVLLATIALYEPGIETTAPPQTLLPLSAEEVNEIGIRNGEQRAIILKRDSEKVWQMVEPVQVAANRYKVDTVLAILKQQPTNRFAVDEQKLAKYGLQNPQVELLLNGKHRLIFGAQTALNNERYLRIGDEIERCREAKMPQAQGCAEVSTIKDIAYYPVASLYTNFIASRLLPEGAKIDSIQLPEFRVAFKEGGWTLEQSAKAPPVARAVGADQLAQWLDGWRYASSVDIEPIADDSYRADQLDEVVITLHSGEVLRLTIFINEDDTLVLGRPDLGIEYHMSDSQRDLLLSPPQPEPQQEVVQ